jgi:hypothetical protein
MQCAICPAQQLFMTTTGDDDHRHNRTINIDSAASKPVQTPKPDKAPSSRGDARLITGGQRTNSCRKSMRSSRMSRRSRADRRDPLTCRPSAKSAHRGARREHYAGKQGDHGVGTSRRSASARRPPPAGRPMPRAAVGAIARIRTNPPRCPLLRSAPTADAVKAARAP